MTRTGRTGHLYVDDDEVTEGMSQGAFTQLTLTLDMFVGGHRNFDEVAKKADISSPFSGCIQKVIYFSNRQMYTSINVGQCDNMDRSKFSLRQCHIGV